MIIIFAPVFVKKWNICYAYRVYPLSDDVRVCRFRKCTDNRFFGTDWNSISTTYSGNPANIIITCTDNIISRLYVHDALKIKPDRYVHPYEKFIYWLDFGNSHSSGQVVLGSTNIKQPISKKFKTVKRLPLVTELFDYTKLEEQESGPSCSLAEALQKQDLFINSTLAQLGCGLLWKFFRECMIDYHGVFLNLDTMKTNPIKIKQIV